MTERAPDARPELEAPDPRPHVRLPAHADEGRAIRIGSERRPATAPDEPLSGSTDDAEPLPPHADDLETTRAGEGGLAAPGPDRPHDDVALVVRLHHEVVDTPAPRLALSPAQALHLVAEGPIHPRGTEGDASIILPDARGQLRP